MVFPNSTPSDVPRPKTVSSFTVAVALTTLIALAAVAVPLFLLRPRTRNAPRPVISVVSGPVDVIPSTSPAAQRMLVAELRAFAKVLYERAFLLDDSSRRPSPSPVSATRRIEDLFTASARPSLRAHPDVFDPGENVRIERGRVQLNGLVNVGREVGQAFLNVAFDATGTGKGSPVTLRQTGTLLLARVPGGWRVAGFDLRLRQAPVTPSPSPVERTRG